MASIIPERIIRGTIENGFSKCCRLISPIGRDTIDFTFIKHHIINTNKAFITRWINIELYLLKCDILATIKRIIAVILSSFLLLIRCRRTNIPFCFPLSAPTKVRDFLGDALPYVLNLPSLSWMVSPLAAAATAASKVLYAVAAVVPTPACMSLPFVAST